LNFLDAIHSAEIQDYAAFQRNRLAVIAGTRAARGHRKIVRVAVAQNVLNFSRAARLHYDVSQLAVELFAKDRRIPVKIARELLDNLRIQNHAR